MDRVRTLDRWFGVNESLEEQLPTKVLYQNVNIINFVSTPQNSAVGGVLEMNPGKQLPDAKFIDLAFKVFNQNEKDEFLRELLHAALTSVQTGNIENVRRVLLAWEYTALWKKEPEMLREISEENDIEPGIDWRGFLASEEV